MDAVTPLVLVLALLVGAGAALAAGRGRLLRNPWNLMLLAKANYRRPVEAGDGVLGGSSPGQIERLAEEHFGGTFEGVTLGDLFPVLCTPQWPEATSVMLGCLMRHHGVPRGFRPPPWDQYELLRAVWVPRPGRRSRYVNPVTALDYLHLANTYGSLPVRAEDGVIERVPADWFRGYLRSQQVAGDEVPIGVLLRAVHSGDGSAGWRQHAASARRCITGRLKREGVLHPDFDDEVPALQPDRFTLT